MKIFKMRRYGIIKLSKLNITWQTALKNFYHHHLCACAKPFWVVLKIGLDLEKFFSKMAFETHPLIPWNSTNSMALSKIKVFPQIMSRIVYPMLQFQVISTNLPVNIYFNGLRQNLLNLVSSSTLIWYWKCTLKYAMYNELFPLKNRQLTTVLMISEHTNNKSSDHHPLHTS